MTPIVFLMGPTAAGKTDLGVRLAERLPADIVSVDSAMVYRRMDIGTGKPLPEVLARAPHRLLDIREATETYSAGEFRRDAVREIEAIRARGRIPLLVGGTLLYFRALQRGLAPLPRAAPAVRERLAAEGERSGWAALHARLVAVDPGAAGRIHPNDGQRIQRALEVFEVSGRRLSEWHLTAPPPADLAGSVVQLGVAPADRADLHRAIDARFRSMIKRGLVDEVRGLAESPGVGPGASLHASRGISPGLGVPGGSLRPRRDGGAGGRGHPSARPPAAHVAPIPFRRLLARSGRRRRGARSGVHTS